MSRYYIYWTMILFFLISCDQQHEGKNKSFPKLGVKWELISNSVDGEDKFSARFILLNKGEMSLEGNKWALFFNIAPRRILPNPEPQPALVEHINGDWYKLVPDANFNLAAGDSIEILYSGIEGVIKETDAPLGLYMVYYDDQGNEIGLASIEDYQIKPFTEPRQINRNPIDEEPIPTPDYLFKENQPLTLLSKNELSPVIPTPVSYQSKPGNFILDREMIIYHTETLSQEARHLSDFLATLTDNEFKTTSENPDDAAIVLQESAFTVAGKTKEGYRLKISPDQIIIEGNDAAGVFYGIQSLKSLIPLENYQNPDQKFSWEGLEIEDAPRFEYRGLHVDVSRNFQSKATILRMIDLMAFYKLNRFLFYTTEDEGWRLEIPGLPELTEVGARREHTTSIKDPVLHPAYGSGPEAYGDGSHGSGYYTRQDFIDILNYAKERHVKVIPVLNFPAHARAAIKAMEARYQKYKVEGDLEKAEEYRLIDPDDQSVYLSAQAYKDNVVSVARESTYRFYEKVVDEIALMYQEAGLQLDEFHAGGDEVPEGAWTDSPEAAELLEQLPDIDDPKNLQTYFFGKLLDRLEKRNLTIGGWEEVALLKMEDGSYQPNPDFASRDVVPFIWNNLFDYPDLGYQLANAGYKVVLCNVSNFYFDLAYNKDPREPGLYWAGFVNTRDAWTFAPYDFFKTTTHTSMGNQIDWQNDFSNLETLKPENRSNIIGLQAQLWSETIKGGAMIEYYMLPKLMGFAESAWAAPRSWETIEDPQARTAAIEAGWNKFANKLAATELPRLSYLNEGYNYRVPPPGVSAQQGYLEANTAYPGLIIRYSEDGNEPDLNSRVYEGRFKPKGNVIFKSFDRAGKGSRSVVIPSNYKDGSGLGIFAK